MEIKLLAITEKAEKLIEQCGRTCYKSFDKKNKKFIRTLIKSGHHSVLEHASATFMIRGISRALTHQLVRHRLASFSQESQRYVDEKGMYENQYYVTPLCVEEMQDIKVSEALGIECSATVKEYYDNIIKMISYNYEELKKIFAYGKEKDIIKKGKINEDARFILPNACCSEIAITANFREWRHIIELRSDKHAQWEIRTVSNQILEILYSKAPSVFEDLYYKFIKGLV